MYGIWDHGEDDFVREMPSKVDDGGVAILAFATEKKARIRAAKHYGYETYAQLKKDGIAETRQLA